MPHFFALAILAYRSARYDELAIPPRRSNSNDYETGFVG
jgi:hypothetical protein